MSTKRQIPLEPRKTPVQARSTVTVEAIYEATFQVLLAVGGPERLTTTRVAERAGVSVGTLYQYFPNKQSLLFSVLEKHLDRVVSAVELACRRNHGQQVSTMIESVVEAFVDAKMERLDISMALYATVGAQERSLTNKVEKRARVAIASMLATAPNTKFADLPFTSLMLISAMGGGNTSRSRSWGLAKDGAFIAKAVSPALPGLPDECSCPNLKGQRREVTASDNSILG